APQSIQEITHYENFPVASVLCPPRLRPAIAAIYWFARTADDLADEGDATPQQRLDDLAAFRADLIAATSGEAAPSAVPARWPQVFNPLAVAIAQYSLPIKHLDDLLSAFEQDIRKTRDSQGYANEAELHDYCARSANPVGRLLLHLYGINDDAALGYSDHICTALQLINFWQDLSQDIPRGRFYLPEDACAQFNVSRDDLRRLKQTENTTKLIATQAVNTLSMMQKGSKLVHLIPGRAGWELRFVVQGGLRILDKIKALDYAMLEKRPKLTKLDFVVIGWRALWM
ncbi:MAG: squalene synthase HpnC, partial [Pseudomonadota bacterium]